jgi:DNA-binding LacI/PurR family transcriptional regulator
MGSTQIQPDVQPVRRDLRQAVLGGSLKVGERLESERQLAERYGLPRTAISEVLGELADEGLLVRKKGRAGTVVASSHPTRLRSGLKQIFLLLTHFRQWSANDNYFYDIIRTIQESAREEGYSLNLWSPPTGRRMEDVLDEVVSSCGGLVLMEEEFGDDVIAGLREQHVWPIVLNRLSQAEADCVAADNPSGVKQAMEYLYRLGHRRIGYMGYLCDPNNRDRENAFLHVSTELGLDQVGHILRIEMDIRKLRKAGLSPEDISLLESAKIPREFLTRHTAVLCSNDYVANSVLRICRENDVKVPSDLSVVGFCDIALAEKTVPPLTTVRIDSEQIGRTAVQLFLERLRQRGQYEPMVRRIPVQLITRESCNHAKETGPNSFEENS